MTAKQRPLVDPSVFELAKNWLENYETIADREDLTWELAGELQSQVEAFCDVETEHGRLREKP